MSARELKRTDLFRPTRLDALEFKTTADLEPVDEIIGQSRAVEAVQFGVDIQHEGYHIFALGPAGTGKRTLVQQFLEKKAVQSERASDWCYVNNFTDPHRPIALSFAPGGAGAFRRDVEEAIAGIGDALPKAFESESYVQRRKALEQEVFAGQREELESLYKQANEAGLEVTWTPGGIGFQPTKNGKALSPAEIESLPEEEKERLGRKAAEIEQALVAVMERAPEAQRTGRKRLNELNREIALETITPFIKELTDDRKDLPKVLKHCEEMQKDLVDQFERFLMPASEGSEPGEISHAITEIEGDAFSQRYSVNVVVDNSAVQGAPVVYEPNPTYQNVIGRIEYLALMGALVTNFTLIKGGALHRANGGYLVLDANHILTKPFVWDGLKRALRSGAIRIESPGQELGLVSTITLDPEPVPLKVKIVLLGEPLLYELLSAYDSEFPELFKVPADFETDMNRTGDNEALYVRLVASLCKRFNLLAFDREAVTRVIEYGARMAGDAQKLSIHMRSLTDFLREADYWARQRGHETIVRQDVDEAYANAVKRSSRASERVKELMARQILLIDTAGEKIGQINGLSVFSFGDVMFGRPVRVTARTRMGEGQVVDIEREVELGGATHSKGVLILHGFLTGRYTKTIPLSLSASIVFEQSYGHVEGDSASLAEVCALVSSVAEIPIKQCFAITGSINQNGDVQAIGAVNEKIEGFFDVCRDRGLTGEQGVIIPASNTQHLMLRPDVVEAVEQGKFHVHAVESVDDAMELLTGMPAGARGEDGQFPRHSVNGLVCECLEDLAEKHKKYSPLSRNSDID